MNQRLRAFILNLTKADEIDRIELIQGLWSGYGSLSRIYLKGCEHPSVILKHIQIPSHESHPRGMEGAISKERKRRSYQVELRWYLDHNHKFNAKCKTPRCLGVESRDDELFLLLEDLASVGFPKVLNTVSLDEVKVALSWLAHFHARHLGCEPLGLWERGTYWHLATRPDELERIRGTQLYQMAPLLDERLSKLRFSTFVHGDAKLANFCFSEDGRRAAAVDFQYVGGGCGIQDVAYFLGSCLSSSECDRLEAMLLAYYFEVLTSVLPSEVKAEELEAEWRSLYPVAWADFERFMLGWSPSHKKLTPYSDKMTKRAIELVVRVNDDNESC